jgi:hypothetical protein
MEAKGELLICDDDSLEQLREQNQKFNMLDKNLRHTYDNSN